VSRPKVLLVDDIEENLIALEALLRKLDIEIVTAHSGREALEHLLVHDFALALLDVNMPEMDGFQLAELMRGMTRTRAVPIVFVTAAYDPGRVFQGYDVGAVDFLVKPVDPRILLGKVQTFIELWASKRDLAESLRLHETFVAALNHDLRTPLATISLGATMLKQIEDPNHAAIVSRVEAATNRMTMMLDQLYDLARTRLGGGIELDRKPCDVATVARDVLKEAELRKGDRILELETRGDTNGNFDCPRLTRVAANLITNAITHGTKHGVVRVVVDGTADDILLTVHNHGVIPVELLPRIFDAFRRGSTPTQGLGLGLYIVREIARAHGGNATVTSTEPEGTTFVVRLPRA
jgi:two-component system, sensor histidine kinase and response regulator